MVIQGNQLGEYVNRMIKRMGFENAEQMFFTDQLWRARFSDPLPDDYYHPKDCHLLELDREYVKGGLTFIV
jgi:hypothetical protein